MAELTNLKSTNVGNLLERTFSPREMILEPWLRNEETCILWAATGVGKTMFSLGMALAVAGGGVLGDWTAPKARRVLYIDGEMNIRDLKERLQMMVENLGIVETPEQKADALNNLTIIARQDQELGSTFYDITDPEHQELLVKRVAGKYDLMILDNFTTLTNGLDDENDATAFKKVQDLFLELKRDGVSTVLVHHANKGGKSMRGSTALAATFEVIIGLKKPKLSSAGQAKFVAEFEKYRSKGDSRIENRTWTLEENGWVVTEDLLEDPKEEPVYVALKSLLYTSGREISVGLGISNTTVANKLNYLIAKGVITAQDKVECFKKAKELRMPGGFTPVDFVNDNEKVVTEAF